MARWDWDQTEKNILVTFNEEDHQAIEVAAKRMSEKLKIVPDRYYYDKKSVSYHLDRAKMWLYGEAAFATVFKLPINTEWYFYGDDGYDFTMKGRTVEVRLAPWIRGFFPIRDNIDTIRYDIGALVANPSFKPEYPNRYEELLLVGFFERDDTVNAELRHDQGKPNWVMKQQVMRPIGELVNWYYNT